MYFLIIALVLLLLCSYYINGKDLFAPSTMLVMTFLFSSVCATYNLDRWKFVLSDSTVVVILVCLAISIAINAFAHFYMKNIEIKKKNEVISQIPMWFSGIVVAALMLICFAMLYEVRRIGGSGTFTTVMSNYRAKNAYGTNLEDQLPGWIRQLLNFSGAICYIYIFNLLVFIKDMKIAQKLANLVVILLCLVTSLLTGGRFSALSTVIAGVVMFYFLRIKKTGFYKVFKLSSILKIIVIVVALLYAFYSIKSFVGRASDDTVVEYITHYAGGSIPGFELYLGDSPMKSNIVGKETFYSLINGLRKLGIIDVPYYYVHHEFRLSNGNSIGNIYTALRDYHYDFGFFGLYLLHIVFSLFFSIFYEYEKRKCSNIGIIMFSMIYYCVALYVISNYFFASVLSFGFLIKGCMVILLYILLLRKKVRIRIK